MSCPNWEALIAERDHTGEDPAGWKESLHHREDCPACRKRALRADPTLLFRQLPEAKVSRSEIEAIRQGVHALREASRLGVGTGGGDGLPAPRFDAGPEEAPRRPVRGWKAIRWPARGWLTSAAAAGLALLALTLAPAGPEGLRSVGAPRLARQPISGEQLAWDLRLGNALEMPADPLIEDLDLPDPRVYQIAEEGVQVVMVIDPSLDLDL